MATANTPLDTLNGLFKEIYAEKIENLIPDGVRLYNMIPFNKDDKQPGNLYHQPVVLGLEHGVTYGGPDGAAFNLESAVAGVMKDAQVQGFEVVLRSVLSTAAASRSLKGGAQAFEKATKFLVANMLRSITRRLEVQLMYGKKGIGEVLSIAANVITIEPKKWAPGIWAGSEGMPIDIFDVTLATKRGTATITAVDFKLKTITVDVAPAGVVATDEIFYKNAQGKEFDGVESIITNTGTLFNISAVNFALWKGNEESTTAAISFDEIELAIARAVEKGLTDQDVQVIINPSQWNKLLNDQAAKREYDNSYSSEKMINGAKMLEFYGQNGKIMISPSIYCKEGDCFLLCMDEFVRVGSSDVTFKQPGFEGEFFRLLENSNGYELRAYTDQALFCYAPGKNTLLTITTL